MEENRNLPQFDSLDELVAHFETHDWGNYIARMPKAEFDVDIKRRVHLVALDAGLADRLTEIAKARHTSSEVLVNTWIREKVLAGGALLRESEVEYRTE